MGRATLNGFYSRLLPLLKIVAISSSLVSAQLDGKRKSGLARGDAAAAWEFPDDIPVAALVGCWNSYDGRLGEATETKHAKWEDAAAECLKVNTCSGVGWDVETEGNYRVMSGAGKTDDRKWRTWVRPSLDINGWMHRAGVYLEEEMDEEKETWHEAAYACSLSENCAAVTVRGDTFLDQRFSLRKKSSIRKSDEMSNTYFKPEPESGWKKLYDFRVDDSVGVYFGPTLLGAKAVCRQDEQCVGVDEYAQNSMYHRFYTRVNATAQRVRRHMGATAWLKPEPRMCDGWYPHKGKHGYRINGYCSKSGVDGFNCEDDSFKELEEAMRVCAEFKCDETFERAPPADAPGEDGDLPGKEDCYGNGHWGGPNPRCGSGACCRQGWNDWNCEGRCKGCEVWNGCPTQHCCTTIPKDNPNVAPQRYCCGVTKVEGRFQLFEERKIVDSVEDVFDGCWTRFDTTTSAFDDIANFHEPHAAVVVKTAASEGRWKHYKDTVMGIDVGGEVLTSLDLAMRKCIMMDGCYGVVRRGEGQFALSKGSLRIEVGQETWVKPLDGWKPAKGRYYERLEEGGGINYPTMHEAMDKCRERLDCVGVSEEKLSGKPRHFFMGKKPIYRVASWDHRVVAWKKMNPISEWKEYRGLYLSGETVGSETYGEKMEAMEACRMHPDCKGIVADSRDGITDFVLKGGSVLKVQGDRRKTSWMRPDVTREWVEHFGFHFGQKVNDKTFPSREEAFRACRKNAECEGVTDRPDERVGNDTNSFSLRKGPLLASTLEFPETTYRRPKPVTEVWEESWDEKDGKSMDNQCGASVGYVSLYEAKCLCRSQVECPGCLGVTYDATTKRYTLRKGPGLSDEEGARTSVRSLPPEVWDVYDDLKLDDTESGDAGVQEPYETLEAAQVACFKSESCAGISSNAFEGNGEYLYFLREFNEATVVRGWTTWMKPWSPSVYYEAQSECEEPAVISTWTSTTTLTSTTTATSTTTLTSTTTATLTTTLTSTTTATLTTTMTSTSTATLTTTMTSTSTATAETFLDVNMTMWELGFLKRLTFARGNELYLRHREVGSWNIAVTPEGSRKLFVSFAVFKLEIDIDESRAVVNVEDLKLSNDRHPLLGETLKSCIDVSDQWPLPSSIIEVPCTRRVS